MAWIEARLYNAKNELCTKALCTYYLFSEEKAREEMNFKACTVEE
jgi:hypothetical protein